jgi:hypothetical protein
MNLPGIPDVDDGLVDKHLNAELIFDVGTGHERKGHVVKCGMGTSGEPNGRAHANPLFDTVSAWLNSRMDHPRTTLRMSLPSAGMHESILRGTNINSSAKSRTTSPIIRLSKLRTGSQPVAMVTVSQIQQRAAGPSLSHGMTVHPIGYF